jgi:RES domain-containing protein
MASTLNLWRISEFVSVDGAGGLLVSGRWHTKGRRIVYLAETSALALLEVLVHLEVEVPPPTFQLIQATAPESIAWETWPEGGDYLSLSETQAWGDGWLSAGRTALAKVPSVVAPHGVNWLLNPLHADASLVEIVQFRRWPWDKRLFPDASVT